jgi:hypothetical protein
MRGERSLVGAGRGALRVRPKGEAPASANLFTRKTRRSSHPAEAMEWESALAANTRGGKDEARMRGEPGARESARALEPRPMALPCERAEGIAPQYRWFEGELFAGPPSFEDVWQGMVRDCHLIAAFAAIAHAVPELLVRIVRDDPSEGGVSVYLPDVRGEEKIVRVTRQLPVRRGLCSEPDADEQLAGAASTRVTRAGTPERWVSFLEKAFAQEAGGYDVLNDGGDPGEVMAALTGWPAQKGRATEWDVLLEATRAGHAAVASSIPPAISLFMGSPLRLLMKELGVLPLHAYTLLGVRDDERGRTVTLRNPVPPRPELSADPRIRARLSVDPDYAYVYRQMDLLEITHAHVKHGTFDMPYRDFARAFEHVQWVADSRADGG